MPLSPHAAQIERSFGRALARAGVDYTWGEVGFKGIPNGQAAPPQDGVDRNEGDSTNGEVSVLRSAFPGDMPKQGDDFSDAGGWSYRIAEIDYTPGLPVARLILGNIFKPA